MTANRHRLRPGTSKFNGSDPKPQSAAETTLEVGEDGRVDPDVIPLSELVAGGDTEPAADAGEHDGRARPRKTPCASCPYRTGVASGIWHPEEYEKLVRYDGETFEQPVQTFMCHQGEGDVCSGWLGHADPSELLAVRIGIMRGDLHPECADYTTDVPLFSSGAEAADHGLRDLQEPGEKAISTIDKLVRLRNLET
ncbi:DUF6283 family protein [Agromyces sp. NPDC057679]|uniref:DUF6283 family protein n=1 Tax=Agromyces sp. NPDC057679 TaxID=3346207 RepID=UPI00366F2F0D